MQAEAAGFAARYSLTRRESEVLELLLAGMNNQQIARQLYISVGTVKAHTHNIFAKTGVGDRAQLADAVRQGEKRLKNRRKAGKSACNAAGFVV